MSSNTYIKICFRCCTISTNQRFHINYTIHAIANIHSFPVWLNATTKNQTKPRTKKRKSDVSLLWVARRAGLQIDSLPLDDIYLGKKKLPNDETVRQWNEVLSSRVQLIESLHTEIERSHPSSSLSSSLPVRHLNLGDGGALQRELDAAIAIVQR